MNTKITPLVAQPKISAPIPLRVETDYDFTEDGDVSVRRSPFQVPLQYETFARSFDNKNNEGLFLGRTPHESRKNRQQFTQICRVAKAELIKGTEALEPTPQALDRTKTAAKQFFTLSYQLLEKNKGQFPLAGLNKCMGMVAVPTTNLVIIAISQDKNPEDDVQLRKEFVAFLEQLNQSTNDWTFELACIPTQAQYFMPRTISMRTPQAASESSIKPHTRCVEVALMAALCKAGRTKNFTSADTGIIAFGSSLWANPKGDEAIPHFQAKDFERSTKYTEQAPLEVVLTPSLSGWIDIWEPCPQHCKIYKYEMLAIGAAGGFSSSFFEPRAEKELKKNKPATEKNMINKRFLLGVACGSISVAIGAAALYFRVKKQYTLKDKASIGLLITSSITLMASLNLLLTTKKSVLDNTNNKTSPYEKEPLDVNAEDQRKRSDSCPF